MPDLGRQRARCIQAELETQHPVSVDVGINIRRRYVNYQRGTVVINLTHRLTHPLLT